MTHADDRTRSGLAARTQDSVTPPVQVPPGRRQRTWLSLFLLVGLTLLTVGLLRGTGALIAVGLIMAGLVEVVVNRYRTRDQEPHQWHRSPPGSLTGDGAVQWAARWARERTGRGGGPGRTTGNGAGPGRGDSPGTGPGPQRRS
ncbi:hypothetical protein GCM10009677_22670 [Sphaerisporangium rubeum]|uniref:DUF3040 domain-containing protein n=1 Tax=Sphaerisporangium rubeum TaxID=321317 RepID=A0A7X0MAS5_9ACTN|nr:hypothetical protein [Sphaerisporangium rubeum]MBB6476346.1 hypothetical protein [Sphaerisporangium rubeum]